MDRKIMNGDVKKEKVTYNPFETGPLAKAVPSTEAQKEIWGSMAMDPNATLCYNESMVIEFRGNLIPETFNAAFQELLKKHDALRSAFSSDGKAFFIKEYLPAPITYLENAGDLGPLKKAEVQFKYDLVNGPCYRATLVKVEEGKFVFLLSAHHIICDGWSFGVLLRELGEFYDAFLSSEKITSEEGYQFADFAVEECQNGANEAHRSYWLHEFETPVEVKAVPLDFNRPDFRTFNSARYDVAVHAPLVKALKKLGSTQGSSLYSTLMSVMNVFFLHLTKSREMVIGMATATQSAQGHADLVGHMVSLLPLRMPLKEDVPFDVFMKMVRSKMLDAFEHPSYSYGSLVRELKNLPRDPSGLPLLNVVLNIDQQTPDQGLSFRNLDASYTTIPRDFENFEIFINAVSRGDELIFECQYNTNLFSSSTIENWFSAFLELMRQVVATPTLGIGAYELPYLKKKKNASVPGEEKVPEQVLMRNPQVEEKIKAIWSEVLLNASIHVEDNFFSLGGHSLLAIDVAQLLEQEFKAPFTIKDIFENPTILKLSHKIGSDLKGSRENLPALMANFMTAANVSHNQMQVWYLEEMHPQTLMHNLPASIRLKSKIDRSALEKTLHFIIERHPSLRTSITTENGAPVQRILDKGLARFRPALELVKTDEDQVLDLLNHEAQKTFDKKEPPLFMAKLFELGPEDYVFFFMVHHAVWDGWSFDIFFEELNIVYTAIMNGEAPNFSKNPDISYVDYTTWLHDLITEKILNKQVSYWKEKLKGPLPILDLPSDHKRPLVISHEGGTLPFILSSDKTTAVREFAKRSGASLFNVFLTAFKVTLSRYSGLDDIIVGLPVRGRSHPEIMHTIGYFVNTVALRTQVHLNKSFEENLRSVEQTCLEAFDNQLVPFQIVLNEIEHGRDPARTPVFQTFFSYQDVNNRSSVLNGAPYTQINIDKASAHTDMDLWIKSSDRKIEGAFEYRKDLFKKVTVERFSECFLHVLDALLEDSKKPLNIMTAIPLHQQDLITLEWNDTWTQTDSFVPFHKMFEKNALFNPDSLAIETKEESISFGQLNRLANRYANALIEKGVGRGDLAGISLTRNIQLVAAILGTLKSGAGYVPLDPGFPDERLGYMIESSTPKILITEESLTNRFNQDTAKIHSSEVIHEARFDKTPPEVINDLDDTIYVIYTSGSTGNPKGVQLTHGSVINFLLSMRDKIGFGMEDKILAVTTLSFDIAVLELFLPMITGGSFYLASSKEAMDGKALRDILESKKISLMQATPSTWRLLLASGWSGGDVKVLCGGEAFPIDLAKSLIPISEAVWNMYGPTETTVWSSCKKLSLDDEAITIGRPIANTTLYILDDNRFMKPIGATGELFIGGLGLAKGYFKREDLTIERFMPDPFIPGKKMYATGDLARFTSQGEVECLGRNDGQVKVRGYRIELGEIEAELQRVTGVREAAVIVNEYRPGDVRIFAYLSTEQNLPLEERALRESLMKKLPAYMIPAHFTFMESIPKTLNGKIDKKSLPKIQAPPTSTVPLRDPETTATDVPASNTPKESLRSLWKEVLGVSKLDDSDNFFNIGGNSMLAVQLFAKITATFKVVLPLSVLIEAEDFDAFARILEGKFPSAKSGNESIAVIPQIFKSLVAIKSNGAKNPFFCFHGVGGNILNYVSLVPAMKNERPLLALQSLGLDRVTPPLNSIENMAKHYIREIKLAQPEGPYLLAGGSMGGMIALEVAMQLTKAGEKIDKLIMFDTFGPNLDLKAYNPERGRSLVVKIRDALVIRSRNMLNRIQSKVYRKLGLPVPLPILLIEIERMNYQAIWKYYPKERFQGNLHLVRSKLESTGWYSDPVMGWKGLINGDIKTYEINGTHENFIESAELITVLKKII